ncbi:MAG: FtsX-like permease family protein [Thermaurantiacus sp.]|uniref:ABC transporter permease n=1 Tax=Thermaurantiacus sp. TaxID=2820283 RepID=UPI00298ED501|nr:FtsX-like permease family protein [Thermaurantiacus sp.]MDW8414463.1 FtsX-like permease family protein [Thermaurantiacus sp.]
MNRAHPPPAVRPRPGTPARWLAWRLARREIRGGLGHLRLLVACLFLGVFALSAVGSLRVAIERGLAREGQAILGGDVEVRLTQRFPTPAERAELRALGTLSEVVRMRAMLRGLSGAAAGREALAELKAVDERWPLYGEARLEEGGGRAAVRRALTRGVVVAQSLARTWELAVGDRVALGEGRFVVAGILAHEPDRAGEGFGLGPTVLLPLGRLGETGLLQPGSLFRWHGRLALPPSADPAAVTRRLEAKFPHAGWRLADRRDGAPGVRRFVVQLADFLSLVSLAALAVAGIGVANGVGTWLEGRSGTIASLKTLGASAGLVRRTYLAIILGVGAAAALAGGLAGTLVPWLVGGLLADTLPVPTRLAVYPEPVLVAMGTGLLAGLAFAIPPLARAGALPAQRLFRGRAEPWPWPSTPALALALGLGAAVAGLAIARAPEPRLALGLLAGGVAALALLWGLAQAVVVAAARLPRPRRALLRLALANLHRPGAQTGPLVVALGAGLSLFAALTLIESSFAAELAQTVPKRAPGFFVLDLPKDEEARFRALLPSGAEVATAPSLRGPLVAVNGTPVTALRNAPESAWVLRGDRGLTFAERVPEGNRIVAGRWWPEGYRGEPLVSMDAEQARLLGLGVGDRITVSVLGVELTARIASLREIRWDSLGINFALVFDPATLEAAPYSWLATVRLPPAAEPQFLRAMARAFPTASVVRVKEVVEQVEALARRVGLAVRASASVAILAGLAVLVGAIAAQARARIYDAVILKALGATRRQLLASAAVEYALLALVVSGLALGLGALVAHGVLTRVMGLAFRPDWAAAALVVGLGAVTTLALGLVGAWRALGAPVAQTLREL